MFRKRTGIGMMLILAVVLILAGCSSNVEKGEAPLTSDGANSVPSNNGEDVSSEDSSVVEEADDRPVTVKLFRNAWITDGVFKDLVTDPLAEQYPHITIELQKDALSGGSLEEVITAGETPDLILVPHNQLPSLENLALAEDMTPLLKKHDYDLNRFDAVYLDAIRMNSDGGLYAIPYYAQLNALYYNKDLFDKFAVDYPPDGMTWDEAIELARNMTRFEDGVQYEGLNIEHVGRMTMPWSQPLIEESTVNGETVEVASLDFDAFQRIFETTARIQLIEGNQPINPFETGFLAMFATVGDNFQKVKTAVESGTLNAGVAQYPSYKEMPNEYGMVDQHTILVTKTSENKDAAMKVVEVITSYESQLKASKEHARMSPLKDSELKEQFGSEYLPGVDTQSIFKSRPAPGVEFSRFYPDARNLLHEEYLQYVRGEKDINTALRDLEDKINQMLKSNQAQ